MRQCHVATLRTYAVTHNCLMKTCTPHNCPSTSNPWPGAGKKAASPEPSEVMCKATISHRTPIIYSFTRVTVPGHPLVVDVECSGRRTTIELAVLQGVATQAQPESATSRDSGVLVETVVNFWFTRVFFFLIPNYLQLDRDSKWYPWVEWCVHSSFNQYFLFLQQRLHTAMATDLCVCVFFKVVVVYYKCYRHRSV